MPAEIRPLTKVFAALLGLLAATVALSFAPLGSLSPLLSFGIAGAKALLIFWFFMGFRAEGWPARLAVMAGGVWVSLLLTLSALEFFSRGWPG